MWLVLCEGTDVAALWAAEGLRRRGEPVEVVSAEVLAYALRWEHRLGSGPPAVEVTLADGRVIRSGDARGVLNRLVRVPTEHLGMVSPEDRAYGFQELYAFFLGWLRSFGRTIFNAPDPRGLSGPWLSPGEWVWLAAKAGFATTPYRESGDGHGRLPGQTAPARVTALVVGRRVLGDVPPNEREACLALARLTRTTLLGIEIRRSADGPWFFEGANPLPDLRSGGESLADALVSASEDGAR